MPTLNLFPARRNVARVVAATIAGMAFATALLLTATGCGGGSGLPGRGGTPTPIPGSNIPPDTGRGEAVQSGWSVVNKAYVQAPKKWTFLVFMNGANDLEEFGSLNINQMERLGSDANINLVVQFKRIAGRFDTSNGDWSDTRRYFITKDNSDTRVGSPLMSQREGLDAGSPQTLKEFIRWGVQTYPAERYCLVLWNHGAGWRSVKGGRAASGSQKMNPVTRGFSYDDTTDSHIETIEIPEAIRRDDNKKWDIVAFDSSLMQMAEVAYEIRGSADYIVGSEESPPGEGYPYDKFLSKLVVNPDMSPRDLSLHIVQATIDYYGLNSNITHSVLDASKLSDLAPAVDELGAALMNVKGSFGTQIRVARENTESFDYPQNKDLLHFLDLMTVPAPGTTNIPVSDQRVRNAADQVRGVLGNALLKSVNGSFHPDAKGLAIFLPSPLQYSRIDIEQANGFGQRYTALSFAKDAPNWKNFIENGPN